LAQATQTWLEMPGVPAAAALAVQTEELGRPGKGIMAARDLSVVVAEAEAPTQPAAMLLFQLEPAT
jgi:hypothetical protein